MGGVVVVVVVEEDQRMDIACDGVFFPSCGMTFRIRSVGVIYLTFTTTAHDGGSR